MILTFNPERRRFEARGDFNERHLPKLASFRWDPLQKIWFTLSKEIAGRLGQYAQGAAAEFLLTMSVEDQVGLRESQAQDAAIEIPCRDGLEYLPYQRAGIAYALKRTGVLFGDEMGLGKTVQAIGTVNCLPEARRVLVMCPASLRLNWMREWKRWHTGKLRPLLLDRWPITTAGLAVIVSWDSVQKWHPIIAETEWDVLIGDEAHLVKDSTTRRARSVFGGKANDRKFEPIQAKKTMLLTGTAIVNNPRDLWPLIHVLDPQGLGAVKADFERRYVHGDNLEELHKRLRSRVMVRRLKEDVLTELPAKRRQIVLLDVPDAEGIARSEAAALAEVRLSLEHAKAEVVNLPHQEAVLRLRQCRAIAMSEISRIRRESAVRKLPAAVEHIYDILGNVNKLVVFSHHHEVQDGLAATFSRIAVTLDGRTDLPGRQEAVDRFMRDRGTRLFLGSIRAAGLGLTLTAASTVIFIELDWTTAAMMQAEDRCHRIGQHDAVLVQHLVVDGSIDAKMARILISKQEMMSRALDGGSSEGQRSVLDEVLS